MYRKIYKNLIDWKHKHGRKPLLLRGARQVGKSTLLAQFGNNEFQHVHHFNFEQDRYLSTFFEKDLFPNRILKELEIHRGKSIDFERDLVIFDEIQACPQALTSLKYFCEDLPSLALCAAGSLLGVTLTREAFPVGKVEFLDLYPMSFEEFLQETESEQVFTAWRTASASHLVSDAMHRRLWEALIQYYFVGGMPEVVLKYKATRDRPVQMIQEVRAVQHALLDSYHKDVAKHSGKINSLHIVSTLENVPLQLGTTQEGSVKRFYFKDVIPGRKGYADLQGPIDWLVHADLLIKVKICNRAQIPLESFCEENRFKLFVFDSGLLSAMLNIPADAIFNQNYGSTKGFIAENFVACEFQSSQEAPLISWEERNSEIEFLRLVGGAIIPVEVKSGVRTQAKSLQQFNRKYRPPYSVILSAKPGALYRDGLYEIPLFFASRLDAYLSEENHTRDKP